MEARTVDAVVAAALDGLRETFELDLLVISVPVNGEDPRFWTSRSAAIASEDPEVEMAHTELTRLFDEVGSAARWGHYRWMRGRYMWLRGPLSDPKDGFGLAGARRTRLSPVESRVLGELGRAIVNFALVSPVASCALNLDELRQKTCVLVRPVGKDVVAEVHVTWNLPHDGEFSQQVSPSRRAGIGRAGDPVSAVACAAAKAARPRCEVVHAGFVVDGPQTLGLAIVRLVSGDLRIGLVASEGQRESQGLSAVALAVLTASLEPGGVGNEIDLTPTQISSEIR